MGNQILSQEDLITIRKGEQAFNPIKNAVEPAECELIKLKGKGAQWECFFYDVANSSCTIHADRPLECRELQCWDTKKIEAITGKNCLCRYDILAESDPLRGYINLLEEKCSYEKIYPLLDVFSADQSKGALDTLTSIVQDDLLIRSKATALFQLSLQKELFCFGRPLFQSLQYPGLLIRLEGSTVIIEKN